MRLKQKEKVKIKNFTLLIIFIVIIILSISFYISLTNGELNVPENDSNQNEIEENNGGID